MLRQEHAPGEKLFVDYAGRTVPIIDPHSGECRAAQIFVAVLGYSYLTYAEATWSQGAADWLGSRVRALTAFGSVPRAIVPYNLKRGVHKAHRYEPDINPAYQDFAEHYGVAILPARVRRSPRQGQGRDRRTHCRALDSGALRNHQFFSLGELNVVIRDPPERINTRGVKKFEGVRPRWQGQPLVWRHLLLTARDPAGAPLTQVSLRGLQLMATAVLQRNAT